MTVIVRIEDDVLEGTDAWNVGALAVPRAGFDGPVLLTQSDISGVISLDIYTPASSTAVYSTTFAKTLNQDSVSEAVHTLAVDSLDDRGHNFKHQVRVGDVGAGILKGGRRYTMVYQFPTARDGIVKAVWVWNIDALH
jgi:hypothetical protein